MRTRSSMSFKISPRCCPAKKSSVRGLGVRPSASPGRLTGSGDVAVVGSNTGSSSVYQPKAYFYEAVQMCFKLALWSALVFFEHGSEMQLATALIFNVIQLCAHMKIEPMGGEEAALLNLMQAAGLVLNT